MKRAEKDKLINFTLINVFIATVFAIILYVIVQGYTNINPNTAIIFVIYAGSFLTLTGLAAIILSYMRRKLSVVRYSLIPLVLGLLMLVMHFGFLTTKYGYYVYYSLLALIALYIVGVIGYTVNRIRLS